MKNTKIIITSTFISFSSFCYSEHQHRQKQNIFQLVLEAREGFTIPMVAASQRFLPDTQKVLRQLRR